MKIHRRILMFKYWLKILTLKNTSLVKSLYNVLKADAYNNVSYKESNWAFQIKSLLNEMGLHNVWINQDIWSIKLGEIKTRITDIYKQNWYACINNSRSLETYSLYKHEFELETYFENISINKFRV